MDPRKKFAIGIGVLSVVALAINIFCASMLVGAIERSLNPQAGPEGVAHVFRPNSSTSSSSVAPSNEMTALKTQVQQLVEPYGDKVAVVVSPLDGSAGFGLNENTRFVSASMIKLLILAEFLNEVDEGVRSLDSVYTLSEEDKVGGTGIMQNDAPGTTYTYDDLARNMIVYSDNTATNILIDSMGMSKINERAMKLKLSQTDLQRKMMDTDSGKENHISAADASTILTGIANHTLASEAMCRKAESYLQAQTDNEGLAQGIPHSVPFGHKTGTLNSIRHDAGIVYADKRYVIVTLTGLDTGEANSLMARISETVFKALK